jgi:SAM-dependent methyltransferase
MKTRHRQDDAYGHEVYDFLRGKGGYELIERADGHIEDSGGPAVYFAPYKKWGNHEKAAVKLARGRVLDIGCGAGRHALHLQGKGLDVTGIDASPLAVKTCRLRGLRKARVLPIEKIRKGMGPFDTIMMMGNNFGLMGSPRRGKKILRMLHRITTDDARIIAESCDPYRTDDPFHLSYHKFNRRRGRMAGQLRIRARYKTYIGAWFDYLLVSKPEMKTILAGTGWRLAKTIDSGGAMYIAVLEKV